jgi:hypothetical protein
VRERVVIDARVWLGITLIGMSLSAKNLALLKIFVELSRLDTDEGAIIGATRDNRVGDIVLGKVMKRCLSTGGSVEPNSLEVLHNPAFLLRGEASKLVLGNLDSISSAVLGYDPSKRHSWMLFDEVIKVTWLRKSQLESYLLRVITVRGRESAVLTLYETIVQVEVEDQARVVAV